MPAASRHVEWLKFLRQIERQTPAEKELHLIADNYATHKHPAVRRWLAIRPRFHMRFTPTSASWLNMLERFFRDITVERLHRGVFTSARRSLRRQISSRLTSPASMVRRIRRKVVTGCSRSRSPNFVSATAPTGFTYLTGGLNSKGCDGSGGFFCFKANTTPVAPALPADSTLSYVFTVTTSAAGSFPYVPDFKINWVGTQNNYDLVSLPLTPTAVPLPAAAWLLLSGLAGMGAMARGRVLRRRPDSTCCPATL